MRAPAVAVGLWMTLFAPAATGLQGQAVSGEPQSGFCWRGQPLPACRGFALYELEMGLPVASTTIPHGLHRDPDTAPEVRVFGPTLEWHFGAMRNLSEEWALGAAVSLGSGASSPLTGVRVRARRWLDPPMSADFEAGAVDTAMDDVYGAQFGWGPSVGARLNMGNNLSVFTRWEGTYAKAGSDTGVNREAGFHQGLYVGGSVGSSVALAATLVVVVFALALNAAYSSDF